MIAEMNIPLAKTDDGHPIRVGLSPIRWDERDSRTLALDYYNPYAVTEVDANGFFQFYVPEGVCLPFLLDNGEDKIWNRTENHELWEKEGVLVKPGKITTVEFRVKPRLDSRISPASLPILEEQVAAAKLLMIGGRYELNDANQVEKVTVRSTPSNPPKPSKPSVAEMFELLAEFPQLKELTLQYYWIDADNVPMGVPLNVWKKLENIPLLETLTVVDWSNDNDKEKTYHGKEEVRETLEKLMTNTYRDQFGGMGSMGGGVFSLPQGGMGGYPPQGGPAPVPFPPGAF